MQRRSHNLEGLTSKIVIFMCSYIILCPRVSLIRSIFSNTFHTCVSHAQDYYCKQISKVVQHDPVILAKLLSPLNKIPTKILSTEKEEYISHILDCGVLKVFCCNLYQGLTVT